MNTLLFSALLATGWLPNQSRWDTRELPVTSCVLPNASRTDLSQAEQLQALERGASVWFATSAGGAQSCTTYSGRITTQGCRSDFGPFNGQNQIMWLQDWSLIGAGGNAIGVTIPVPRRQSCGSVTDNTGRNHNLQCTAEADIYLNDQNYFWSNSGRGRSVDAQSIIAHEYGHLLGLDHCDQNGTCRFASAIMYSSYSGGILRSPQREDIAGVCGLYPGRPGGLGWPCSEAGECSNGLCIDTSSDGYCTSACGLCPDGYSCKTHPENNSGTVCVRDRLTEQALCEPCRGDIPNACADNGLCVGNLPEPNEGRCISECPDLTALRGGCPEDYGCRPIQGGRNVCVPYSSDCTDLKDYVPAAPGDACDFERPCDTGPCLNGRCFRSCLNAPEVCADDELCQAIATGDAICRPRPPQPDAGMPAEDAGVPEDEDAGPEPPDASEAPDATTPPVDAGVRADDAGVRSDAGTRPGEKPPADCACDADPRACDLGCACDLACQDCACDRTTACDAECGHCDIDCAGCTCDVSTSCDPGCEGCDPECQGQSLRGETPKSSGCHHGPPHPDSSPARWPTLLGLLLALMLLPRALRGR